MLVVRPIAPCGRHETAASALVVMLGARSGAAALQREDLAHDLIGREPHVERQRPLETLELVFPYFALFARQAIAAVRRPQHIAHLLGARYVGKQLCDIRIAKALFEGNQPAVRGDARGVVAAAVGAVWILARVPQPGLAGGAPPGLYRLAHYRPDVRFRRATRSEGGTARAAYEECRGKSAKPVTTNQPWSDGRPARSSRGKRRVVDGEGSEGGGVVQVELLHDVRAVSLHRLYAQAEALGDFTVARSCSDQFENLLFASREHIGRRTHSGLPAVRAEVARDDALGHRGADEFPALRDAVDGQHELGRAGVL